MLYCKNSPLLDHSPLLTLHQASVNRNLAIAPSLASNVSPSPCCILVFIPYTDPYIVAFVAFSHLDSLRSPSGPSSSLLSSPTAFELHRFRALYAFGPFASGLFAFELF